MIKSKFDNVYHIILEKLSKDETIEQGATNFVKNLKTNKELNDVLKDEEISDNLKHNVKKVTNRVINVTLNKDIETLFIKKNIDKELFDGFFMSKYGDDVYTFINYINTNGEDSMLPLQSVSANLNSIIANKYGISQEFVKKVMEFNNKKNGVGMGPGELGTALFFKDVKLSKKKGDIEVGNSMYEIKSIYGKIPGTFQPDAALIRRTAVKIIQKFIDLNKHNLKTPILKDEFKQQSWLALYVTRNFEKTQALLRSQFELKNGKKFEKVNGKQVTTKGIFKTILHEIFEIYGSAGTLIIKNLNEIVGDNFQLNVEKLREYTVESLITFYHNESTSNGSLRGFDKFVFFNYAKESIKIIDWNNFTEMKNVFMFPTFGDREGQQQQKTVLSIKA